MVWAILLLVVSALIFVLLGVILANNEVPRDAGAAFGFGSLGMLIGFLGGEVLYLSGTGNICAPVDMPKQIYTVAGQVSTSRGTVAIIEDVKQDVFAVWTKLGDEEQLVLPVTVKFVKPGRMEDKSCLVPVYEPK